MNKNTSTRFRTSTDRGDMNHEEIHAMLSRSYWASDRTVDAVKRSIQQSACIGIFIDGQQVAFARAITDTIHAMIFDVIVHEDYRGQGLGKELMKEILAHPELYTVEKWLLSTRDAHGLYEQFGFKHTEFPQNRMEMNRP